MTSRDEIRRRVDELDETGDAAEDTRHWVEQQLTEDGTPEVDAGDPGDVAAEFRVYDADGELVRDTTDDLVTIATPTAEFVSYAVPEDAIPGWLDRDELPVRV